MAEEQVTGAVRREGRRRLLEQLEERMDELVERIVLRARELDEQDEGYSSVPPEELAATADGFVRMVLGGLAEGREPNDEELAQAAVLGERRARQHVSLESLLRTFRIGGREALSTVQGLAAASGLDSTATLELTIALWDWLESLAVEVTDAHHRVELALARSDQQQRASFVHGLVRGTLAPSRIEERASTFGLDPGARFVVLRARPSAAHAAEEIERLIISSPWAVGLVAVVDDDVVGVLPEGPVKELPVPAGLGPAVELTALPRSFRDATRALGTSLVFGRSGAQRLEDDVLRAAVLTEDHLGEILSARYIEPVRAVGTFGEELLRSVRTYLECEQSIDTAAAELFVHPNTLRHRIARFEEVTGAKLRNCEQLAEVWWAMAHEEAARSQRAASSRARLHG